MDKNYVHLTKIYLVFYSIFNCSLTLSRHIFEHQHTEINFRNVVCPEEQIYHPNGTYADCNDKISDDDDSL
jgi:hypothetical protein